MVWASSEPKRGRGRARDGPTSIKRGQEKCEEDRKEPRGGGGRTAVAAVAAVMAGGGGDGLTPVCLRGANGVLQLF